MTKQAADKGGPPLDLCPFCGKKIADSSRAGSLTSFLFQANNCQCGMRPAQLDKSSQKHSGGNFCPRCGLQTVSGGNAGSLTGFLFQDTRCKCPPERLTNPELDRAKQVYKSVELAPDVVIGGQYRIVNLIGRGGMGEVYLAQHLTLDKRLAIKLIPPDQVTDMGWQRFQIEAKSIARLDHVNLVKVTDFGIHEGCLPYYAMEFVDGMTLAEMLGKRGTVPLSVALDVFMQVCDGVDYAHRNGIVHRDLKPANIMLVTLPSGKLSVKILDFGLAKLTQDDRGKQSLTSVGDVFGSPFYMSPEQCVGGKIDNRSDIYSLGCTLFESLAGRPPFVGATAVDIVGGHQGIDPPSLESLVGRNVFPQAMEVVLAKLLRKNPVERYQSLIELRGDLEKVVRGEDVQPFYMSRTSHVRGQAGQTDLIGAHEGPKEESHRGSLLRRPVLVISLLVVGLIGSLAGSLRLVHKPVTIPAAKEVNQDAKKKAGESTFSHFSSPEKDSMAAQNMDPEGTAPNAAESSSFLQKNFPNAIDNYSAEQSAPASLKDTTPFAFTVVENGERVRVFRFPEDVIIGEFQATKSMGQVLARGKFKFLEGGHVVFVAYPILAKYPGYLKRFRPGDIYTVKFHPGGLDKPDDLLDVMTRLVGVQELMLTGCRELTNNCIPMIEKFRSLKALAIGDDNKVPNLSPMALDVSSISNLSTLKQLESLNVQGFDKVEPILHKLRNSPKIKTLTLATPRITAEGLADIASLSQLETLTLKDTLLSNKDLQILSSLPALKILCLSAVPLDPASGSALRSFKALKELRVKADALSEVNQKRLQSTLTGVLVERQI